MRLLTALFIFQHNQSDTFCIWSCVPTEFSCFLVAQRNLTECHMALFPASHVVVVGGGFAGMVVANQAANFCAFGQTKP
jgi:hypothetical protein